MRLSVVKPSSSSFYHDAWSTHFLLKDPYYSIFHHSQTMMTQIFLKAVYLFELKARYFFQITWTFTISQDCFTLSIVRKMNQSKDHRWDPIYGNDVLNSQLNKISTKIHKFLALFLIKFQEKSEISLLSNFDQRLRCILMA